MARRTHPTAPVRRRIRLAAIGTALALIGAGLGSLPAEAAQSAVHAITPSAADSASLFFAYAEGRHIPVGAVGGIRAGSERVAEVPSTGAEWAVADFLPSNAASPQVENGFQDGASKGLFEKSGGTWRLVQTETQLACTNAIPASVKDALGLTTSASCDTSALPSAAAKAAAARSGTPGSRIASIALGQAGEATTPAQTSFAGVDCDPYSTLDGAFSPNSDGCGPDAKHKVENQNEAWCSDFAKWVWAQAGVTAGMNTLNAGSVSFYAWALAQGQNPAADTGTPAPGDAVVFFPPGKISANVYADHVGLVTSVNANGTVDMVNGDFLGSSGITAEYDQNLSLTSWASSVWTQGEQWVLITPPTAAQKPAPTASIAAPTTAAAGTTVHLAAAAAVAGGSITQYYWTFNDGRNNNVTARSVSHVFQRAGFYTVTMSATSSLGTVTTKSWNIGVSAPSSAISSVPNNSVWYTTDPVMQYEFTPEGNGDLAVDSWDGATWLQQTEPGRLAAGSAISGLTYSDAGAGYATVPHAYYRDSAGSLGETYNGVNGWTSATLPGAPASNSAIAGLAADPTSGTSAALNVTPSVFYFGSNNALNEDTETNGAWSTAPLSLPTTSSPGSLAVSAPAGAMATEYVFYLSGGKLTAAVDVAGNWMSQAIPNSLGVKAGSPLSAATTDSSLDVFFTDAAGKLAVASESMTGTWSVRTIPGTPKAGAALFATNDLSSTGAVGDEVFYLSSTGAPAVTTHTAGMWGSTALPGPAAAVQGVSSNIIPGANEQLFFSNSGGLEVDSAAAPGGTWALSALPSTPTAYPGTVLLYAATPADDTTALAAASFAGLSASQVTTSFATAWGATLSGNHLVIAIGQAAANALYDNPCGWANPSQDDPGSTPFYNVERPLNVTLTNLFLVGVAATASQTPQVADDMAYFAVHGALPSGVTLPALAWPGYTCLGTAG